MKNLIVVFALLLAACGGSKSTAESPTGGPGEPTVDPTLPSWAPASCAAYQEAVVQAINCVAIEQAKRDEIQQTYDAASVRWKAEQDADDATVDEIDALCVSSTGTVRADIAGNCGPTTES